MTLTKALLPATLISMALVGCGGDSSSSSADTSGVIERLQYTGETGAATLTEENMGEFTEVTTALIQNYKASEDLFEMYGEPLIVVLKHNMKLSDGLERVALIDEQPSEGPIEETTEPSVEQGDCGGTWTTTKDRFGGPDLYKTSEVFDNYCLDVEGDQKLTINGTISYDVEVLNDDLGEFDGYGKEIKTFRSLTITLGEDKAIFTGVSEENPNGSSYNSIKVTLNGQARIISHDKVCPEFIELRRGCTIRDYVKLGNTTYRIDDSDFDYYYSNFAVAEQPVSAEKEFYFEGTLFLPEYGYVEMEADNLTFCDNGTIDTGSISFYDDSSNDVYATIRSCQNAAETTFDPAPLPPMEQPQ